MRLMSSLVVALGVLVPAQASAQFESSAEGIEIGDWLFRPSLEIRVRGEYRRNPVDVGGDAYASDAVWADDYLSTSPPLANSFPRVFDRWSLGERARLGLGVSYDLISAQLTLQDARVLGVVPGAQRETDGGGLGEFAPVAAYIHLRSDADEPFAEVRVGRQSVHWGDGRLLGSSDWSPRSTSLDAVRLWLHFGAVDTQLLAAMLAVPTPIPAEYGDQDFEGTGAQLYGMHSVWNGHELLNVDVTVLGRVARDPFPRSLTRSNTLVVGGRLSGGQRGVHYALEGAAQFGEVASYGVNRTVSAFGLAGRVSWLTALPGRLTFSGQGSYASGDDSGGNPGETLSRFDPILPDTHLHGGKMDLYGWSNRIDAGGAIGIEPFDAFEVEASLAWVALAEPGDRWVTETLGTVGSAVGNTSRHLGEEIDVALHYAPWDALAFRASYGVFVLGDGGKAVVASSGRGDPSLLHHALMQVELKVP